MSLLQNMTCWSSKSYNRYTYVENRPLSLTDPTGHEPSSWRDACMGSCSNPNMTVIGGFSIIGTFHPDGANTFRIVYNSDGEMASAQTKTAPDTSNIGLGQRNDRTTSPSNPDNVADSGSAQNAQSGEATLQDDMVNGNGDAKGIKVNVQKVTMSALELGEQGFINGSVPVQFALSKPAPHDGVLVQQVHMEVEINGVPVVLGIKADYAEAWDVRAGSLFTKMREGRAPRDDIFGILAKLPMKDGTIFSITASVRYFDGTTMNDLANNYGFTYRGAAQAKDLFSKYGLAGLPIDNASAVTYRNPWSWPK